MDGDLRSLLLTLFVDLVVVAACIVAFFWLNAERREKGALPDPLSKGAVGGRVNSPNEIECAAPVGLPAPLCRDSHGAVQNVDVRLYLSFLWHMAGLFALLSFLGLAVVLPLNISGHGAAASRASNILAVASAENIAPEESRMWMLYAMTWVYSAVAYAFVWKFRETVLGEPWRAATLEQQLANFTVMVRGLDPRIIDPAVIRQQFERFHGEHLIACNIVHDYRLQQRASEALRGAEDRLERSAFALRCEATKDGQSQFAGHYDQATQRLQEETHYRAKVVQRERRTVASRNMGVCFLIFDSTERAYDTLTMPHFAKIAKAHNWELLHAPPPSDIEWDNLHVSSVSRNARAISLTVTLCVVCVLVVAPLSLLDDLHRPSRGSVQTGSLEISNYVTVMMTGYLPPLFILMINSVVIPFLIHHISLFDRFWQRSSQQSALLHMNILFMIINSLIIPLTSVSSVDLLLKHMFETPVDQWNTALGASFLSSSGSFAIRYLVNAILLSNSMQLIQIGQRSQASVLAALAVTAAEKKRAETRWTFDFGYWYAAALSICFICLVLSVAVPLLLPCGAVFFFVRYNVDKYNFEHGVWNFRESRGTVAQVVVGYMLGAVALMQFCMSGLFLVQGVLSLGMASTLLLAASMATSALLAFRQVWSIWMPQGVDSSCEEMPLTYANERQLAMLHDAYVHPCERYAGKLAPKVEFKPRDHYGTI